MTRPRAADDFEMIERRVRELRGECTCPPGPLVGAGCPVHDGDTRHLFEATTPPPCNCPTDHDVHGVYHKLHVQGCVAGARAH